MCKNTTKFNITHCYKIKIPLCYPLAIRREYTPLCPNIQPREAWPGQTEQPGRSVGRDVRERPLGLSLCGITILQRASCDDVLHLDVFAHLK